MGLSIFYSGKLRNLQQLPELSAEIIDICSQLHWPYDYYTPTAKIPIRGIWFHPPGSDPIWMTFLSNGEVADPWTIAARDIPGAQIKMNERILINPATQYAGPEAHMTLIRLLRYVSKKYFLDFRLTDESEYWETGNAEKCKDWFAMFAVWMNNMSADLGKLDGRGYETGEHFAERMEDLWRNGKSIDDILKVMGNPYRKAK